MIEDPTRTGIGETAETEGADEVAQDRGAGTAITGAEGSEALVGQAAAREGW